MSDKKLALAANLTTMTYNVTDDAIMLLEQARDSAKKIVTIKSPEDMEACNPVLRLIKGCLKFMEESRADIKAPITKLGKDIDAAAKEFSAPLLAEESRLKSLVAAYVESQRAQQVTEARTTGAPISDASAGAGIQTTEVWDFEVEDPVKAFAASPGLFDLVPKRSAIIAAAKAGFPIPFVRTFKKTGVRVQG